MNWAATRSVTAGSTPSWVNRSRLNRDPMTAAALNVRFASVGSRSMRAAMVACSVAGTLTSETSAVEMYAPDSPRSTTLGQFAHDFLGEERITGGPVGDRLAQCANRGVGPEQL